MRATKAVTWLTVLAFLGLTPAVWAAPTPREILGGELIVKDALDRLGQAVGRVSYLPDDQLTQVFPDNLFYRVLPQAAPAGTPVVPKPVRLAAVAPDGRVTLLTEPKDLVGLFKVAFHPAAAAERPRVAVHGVLLLLEAEYPDYTFPARADNIQVTGDPDGGWRVTGRVPAEGNLGTIQVNLRLDSRGEVLDVLESIDLRPTTPVAVALDPATAERLVRAQVVEAKLPAEAIKVISDPGLKQAAPGFVFFLVPQADPDKDDPNVKLNLAAVAPDGKVVTLFGPKAQIGPFLTTLIGPAAGDPGYRKAVGLVSQLAEVRRPNLTFGAPGSPQITNEGNGATRIVTKTPYTNANGHKGVLTVSLTFGKHGKLAAYGIFFNRVD